MHLHKIATYVMMKRKGIVIMETSLGKRIKALREALRITQEELSQRLGLDRASLSLIENDKRSLKADELILLSKTLNISIDELLNLKSSTEVVLEQSQKTKEKKADLRISVPRKNLKKFKEVLLYILGKVGAKPNVGETVLYKLLYFIDFNYYEKYEEQLIGATYIKNHHGPTPLEFQSIVNEMIENKEIEVVKSKYFQHLQKKYLPHQEPDLSVFNANEIKVIDDVLQKLSGMNALTISEYSHQDVPWMVTSERQKIDYESVFYRTPAYSVREYSNDEIQAH
jgi:transcriptional regulator with XRE-family HTH domain